MLVPITAGITMSSAGYEKDLDNGGVGHTIHTTTVQLLAQAHCRESTEQAGINSSHKLLLCSADFIILEPPFGQFPL